MRKIQFLMMVLLLAVAGSGQVFASESDDKKNNGSNGGKDIPTNDPLYLLLLGESETDLPRAVMMPFEAYIVDGALHVGALADLSDVTVTLYHEDAPVYTLTRDFVFMDMLDIPVAACPVGNYMLLLTTPRGTYVYGTFQL